MIGIKGMELPKNCSGCPLRADSGIAFYKCNRLNKRLSDVSKIDKDCPLVDLGKEDMSWEELVEKCSNFKNIHHENVGTECENLWIKYPKSKHYDGYYVEFTKEGLVYFNESDTLGLNKKPFEMWQIINTLIGDER